jgi:uncharacterized protein
MIPDTDATTASGTGTDLQPGPVPPGERIVTLDVLRGIAIWGILFVNVTGFSQPGDWFGVRWGEIGPLDYGVEVLKLFFVQGKFYTLFAFLFGLGFAMQLNRAESRGQGFAWRFLWRMILLWGIGLIHVLYLWDGDILNTYAVGGILLLIFYGLKRLLDRLVRWISRGRRPRLHRRWVPVAGAVLMFGPMLLFGGFAHYAFSVRAEVHDGVRDSEELTGLARTAWEAMEQGEKQLAEYRSGEKIEEVNERFAGGGFSDTLAHRIEVLPRRLMSGPFWLVIAGIFCIGAFFGRYRFIDRAGELEKGFRRLLVAGCLIGVPLSALFVHSTIALAQVEGLSWYFFLQMCSKTASGLAFALVYVAVVTLAMQTRARRWLGFFAPVGRMALSNYLLQSLVNTTVFYGYGLGLMGKLGPFEQVIYLCALFAMQVLASRWWLTRFRYGPAEWLWRSLTYLRVQPMRVRVRSGS